MLFRSHIFFPKTESKAIITQTSKLRKVEFTIKGMTCSGCEHHIKTEVSKLKGIIEVVVSYEKGNAIVKFDNKQTRIAEIEKDTFYFNGESISFERRNLQNVKGLWL